MSLSKSILYPAPLMLFEAWKSYAFLPLDRATVDYVVLFVGLWTCIISLKAIIGHFRLTVSVKHLDNRL